MGSRLTDTIPRRAQGCPLTVFFWTVAAPPVTKPSPPRRRRLPCRPRAANGLREAHRRGRRGLRRAAGVGVRARAAQPRALRGRAGEPERGGDELQRRECRRRRAHPPVSPWGPAARGEPPGAPRGSGERSEEETTGGCAAYLRSARRQTPAPDPVPPPIALPTPPPVLSPSSRSAQYLSARRTAVLGQPRLLDVSNFSLDNLEGVKAPANSLNVSNFSLNNLKDVRVK